MFAVPSQYAISVALFRLQKHLRYAPTIAEVNMKKKRREKFVPLCGEIDLDFA